MVHQQPSRCRHHHLQLNLKSNLINFVKIKFLQSYLYCFYRPQVKSLDSETRNFPDLLSIHLQAKVSVGDESSSQLSTGLHDSWRLSSWSEKLRGAKAFDFEEDSGFVKIPETGLYFVYVQVHNKRNVSQSKSI